MRLAVFDRAKKLLSVANNVSASAVNGLDAGHAFFITLARLAAAGDGRTVKMHVVQFQSVSTDIVRCLLTHQHEQPVV